MLFNRKGPKDFCARYYLFSTIRVPVIEEKEKLACQADWIEGSFNPANFYECYAEKERYAKWRTKAQQAAQIEGFQIDEAVRRRFATHQGRDQIARYKKEYRHTQPSREWDRLEGMADKNDYDRDRTQPIQRWYVTLGLRWLHNAVSQSGVKVATISASQLATACCGYARSCADNKVEPSQQPAEQRNGKAGNCHREE